MKRIIITGGAGFTGTNFTEHYLDRGYRVVVVDNRVYGDAALSIYRLDA